MSIKIISIRENTECFERAVDYFSSKWGIDRKIYEDSISDGIATDKPLPRWYLMLQDDRIIGSYGLIENDFMVRKDLKPWLCALYVEESERCKGFGGKLLAHGRQEAAKLGFSNVYLCTDHVGYYEKHGWRFFGMEESEFGGDTRAYEATSISQAKYEIVPVQNKEKLFDYYNSFKEKVPYYHEASFELWESSMFSDSDSEGDLFFTKLYTYVALNGDVVAGYIQFGIPNFLYNDGGKEYSPRAGVIRALLYDADKPEAGRSLIETALSFFDANDITKRHAFYHALGMTCTAWQGKLFETLFYVESLLAQYGFIKEDKNVYFKRLITDNDRKSQNGMNIPYGDMSSAGTQDISFYHNGSHVGGGNLHYLPQGKVCFLRWIYTNEAFRGSGMGTLCMKQLFCELADKGICRLDTDTIDSNVVAQGFYMKTGFERMGIMRSYICER